MPPITWPPDPVTDEDGARVAAFPFTTIQPNVGRGYVLMPDPAPLLGLAPQDCKCVAGTWGEGGWQPECEGAWWCCAAGMGLAACGTMGPFPPRARLAVSLPSSPRAMRPAPILPRPYALCHPAHTLVLLSSLSRRSRPLHGYAESFCLEAAAADHRTTNIDPLRRWVGGAGWAAPGRPLLWRKVPIVIKVRARACVRACMRACVHVCV